MVNTRLLTIEQVWLDETTRYWFEVNGEQWAISDCNGVLSLLDYDGWTIHLDNKYIELFNTLKSKYEEIVNEL